MDEILLDEKTIRAIKKVFNYYDKNNDGSIDKNELNNLCRNLGDPLTKAELDCALYELDKNNSGKIEWEEFIYYWSNN